MKSGILILFIFLVTAGFILNKTLPNGDMQTTPASDSLHAYTTNAGSFPAGFVSADSVSSSALPDTITITATGDIMPGTLYPLPSLPFQDGKNIFSAVKQYLSAADLTLGNLEGVLLDSNIAPVKNCKDSLNCFAFRSPVRYAKLFKDAGFDVLNIANNHSGDFGLMGIKSTMKALDNEGIKYAGVHKVPYTIYKYKGLTIGVCGFSHNSGTPDVRNYKLATETVRKLDSLCNIVIVSMHIGGEGADNSRITFADEEYLEEKRGNPYKFAREVIDAGADFVWGHGPHITRAVDIYKGRFIAYSLGNFFTYNGISIAGKAGISPLLTVKLKRTGEFISGRIISSRQSRSKFVFPDSTNAALKELSRLTKLDFPDSPLRIDSLGTITK